MSERRSTPEYRRYTQFSDADLLALRKDGEDSFVPAAWEDLNREIASRNLSVDERPSAEISDADQPDAESEPKPAPVGIGGWLIPFQWYVVTQALICLAASVWFLYHGNIWLPISAGASLLSTFIVGMLLIYARASSARSYWIGMMVAVAIGSAVSGLTGKVAPLGAVISTVWAAGWAAYWHQSERVKATFTAETDSRPGFD